MKYYWKAKSNDGCFEAQSSRDFSTHKEAYEDMRECALEKMLWNTEWEDLDDNGDSIDYEVLISQNKIVHKSYSGEYTYLIHEKVDRIEKHGRIWKIINGFSPMNLRDWLIGDFEGVGTMWMNNYDGYIVIIERSGTILKSDI